MINNDETILINTFYKEHLLVEGDKTTTYIFQYNTYRNRYFDKFKCNAALIFEKIEFKRKGVHTVYKSHTPDFSDYDSYIALYVDIFHTSKKINFGGSTVNNVMVKYEFRSLGIGTCAFNLLIKLAKEYSKGNYEVGILTFGVADEEVEENRPGFFVNNKTRRNQFYANFGFNINDSYCKIDSVKELKTHDSEKYKNANLISFFNKYTSLQKQNKETLKSLKIKDELLTSSNDSNERKFAKIFKLSISLTLSILLNLYVLINYIF